MGNKRRIPLTCLGPGALAQIRAAGYDVDAIIAREKTGKRQVFTGGESSSPRAHKYGVSAKDQRTYDGIVFASKLEMNTYKFLREREVLFQCQIDYILQEGFRDAANGNKWIRPIKYVADFLIQCHDGEYILDTKGVRTKNFDMKLKMMLAKGRRIHCVSSLGSVAEFLVQHKPITNSDLTQPDNDSRSSPEGH